MVITTIGYGMYAAGIASAATAKQEGSSGESSSLDPIMLFADSPGTISTVLVMVLRPGSSAGRNSSLISRFLGLILIAMGLQFVLTNLRAFFQAAG